MLVVHIHIHVKPEFVEAFREATLVNARHSIEEPGIARFDFTSRPTTPIGSSWSRSIAVRTRGRATGKQRIT